MTGIAGVQSGSKAMVIWAEGRRVATLTASPDGPWLDYDPAWQSDPAAFPVSLSMPLAEPHWGPDQVMPWLMNLLPEGDPLRAMSRSLGVAREDILGLIAQTGHDLAGALIIDAEPTAEEPCSAEPGYRVVTDDAALARILEELPAKPFLIGEVGVSMSLAGAQEKLPVALIEGCVAIPVNGAPSTHILKPDNPRLPGSVQNEALCMTLARHCGLDVAPITTGLVGSRSYLLVDRYDRRMVAGALAERLHQEDFCQALARPPAAKYERNGTGIRGPSLVEMFALVRAHMTARDTTRLLDTLIFNIAIGNVDSHAKNYSILLHRIGPELAPLYDLMSGLSWPHITQNHAQEIGGKNRGKHIYARHWRRMAEACGLAGPATVRRVDRLAARVAAAMPAAVAEVAAMPAGAGAMLQTFAREIADRAASVRANAREAGPEIEEPPVERRPGGSAYAA